MGAVHAATVQEQGMHAANDSGPVGKAPFTLLLRLHCAGEKVVGDEWTLPAVVQQ